MSTPASVAVAPVARAPWREDLRIAAWLGLTCALAVALLFPYLLDLMPEVFAKVPVPLAVLVPIQAIQGGILLGLLALVGLRMGPRAGLDAPWLRAVATGRPRPVVPWASSTVLGLVAGAAVIGASLLLDPLLPPPRHALPQPAAWKGLLASFYGTFAEEVMARLFLMTLLVWIGARVRNRAPGAALAWFAILACALAFGAGHLPAAAEVWPLDAIVVARTLVLNAIAGVVFGWLYWRRGLEAAMCAHFAADLVLHVLAPLLAA